MKLTNEAYDFRGELLTNQVTGAIIEMCLRSNESKTNAMIQVAVDSFDTNSEECVDYLLMGIEAIILN